MSKTLPTFFIPHGGGPCFFMDWNPAGAWDNMRTFLEGFVRDLPERPKSLLIVTAHWETKTPTVSTNPQPDLLFDYHGFPDHTYDLTWPAPGDPVLAHKVVDLLERAGILTETDDTRGFDHGVFIPMKVAVPDADIPTVMLSIRQDLDPEFHIRLGKALRPLRDQGVLIVGSGLSYHNIGALMGRSTPRGAAEFDDWLTKAATAAPERREKMLPKWQDAPGARFAHPREDHLVPVFVAAGAASGEQGVKVYDDTVLGARVSAFRFG
ncbi:MAG: dioxygenase [Rhodobacteraceae bacterium]|nr:dioxygenase [Paracoccaceae bacterium]